MKIWVDEHNFVEIGDKKSLAEEIAPRSRSLDWMGIMGFLPDPDPVLRKLGQDINVYRQLLSDAHVWSCCQSRKSGTLSCEWELRESSRGSVRANKRAYETIKDMMDGLDVYQIITDMLDAPFYGMSPLEVLWEAGNRGNGETGMWLPDRVVGKPPEWFHFDPENNLRFKSKDDMIEGEEIPDMKFLLPRHHASYQNPYGERLLSRCFWPVTFKRGGFKFWSVFTEKFGMPWIIGRVPRSTNETERGKLLANLTAMVQDAVAVINDDESVDLKESAFKASSASIYEKLISASNRECSKAILGQTLSTELDKGGSMAATQGHLEIRKDLVDQDKRMVCESFKRLFRWVIDLNFTGADPPVFVFYEEEKIQKERSERDTELFHQGVKFKPVYYQRIYNLEEGDFELVEPGDQGIGETEKRGNGEKENRGRGIENREPDSGLTFEPLNLFQESVKKNSELARAYQAQEQIDDLADEKLSPAAKIFEKYKAQISSFLKSAGSLEDAANSIVDLYDTLDAGPLAVLLADALITADKIGVESISKGADVSVQLSEPTILPPAPCTLHPFSFAEWGPALPFKEATDFFKAKAFTISGVAKADLLGGVKDELLNAMETGATQEEFNKSVNSLFDKHGYDRLTPYRLDNIFRTNMQGAYQAGRYRQMTSPGVLKARPYWRLVAVMDVSTRPEHAAMNGKIYRYDHSFWDTWYPPNGFRCRCTVYTVSESEMKRNGWKVETTDPTGGLIEPIEPGTGRKLPARSLLPDPGWGDRTGDLESLLKNKKSAKGLEAIAWKETPGQPGPKDLERTAESKIPHESFLPTETMLPRLDTMMTTKKITESDALKLIEQEYKRTMGISPNESFGILKGPDSEILKVDMNSLAHAMLKPDEGRERYIPYFRKVIEEPYEILLTEYQTAGRKETRYRKKYIGLFYDETRKAVLITAEISPEGWTMYNVMNAKKGTIDRQRRGQKVLWGK